MAAPMKRRRRAEAQALNLGGLPKNWALRGLAALGVGLAGILAVTHSLAYQIRSSDANTAHQLAPYDGRFTAFAAAYLAGTDAKPDDRYKADALARLALRQDPTTAVAASTLGLNAQVRNQSARARVFFRYAEALSRREMQTQLWAIEDSVGRGEIAGALRHYDIVLRTTPSLSEMLFPVLSGASTDQQIRGPLLKTLLAKPSWSDGFISYAASHTTEPRSTATFLSDFQRGGGMVPDPTQANMINTLIAAGFSDDAWAYYRVSHAKADRRMSRDPHFAKTSDTPSVFDWAAIPASGISASIQRSGSSGVFEFAAPAMIGGRLLQQVQLLPMGSYTLSGHSIGVEQTATARPYWLLSCQDGREISRIEVPNSSEAKGHFGGDFTVPIKCPVQTLVFVAKPSENPGGLSGQIDAVSIRPQVDPLRPKN